MRLAILVDAGVQAVDSIRTDPSRATGVMLGVIVAAGALTLLSGIAASGRQALVSAASTGDAGGLVEVAPESRLAHIPAANPRPLDEHDAGLLAGSAALPGAEIAVRRSLMTDASWAGRSAPVRVLGVSAKVLPGLGLRASRGRLLSDGDETLARRVAMLGSGLARRMAPDAPTPDQVIVGGLPFTVVGVLASAPSFSTGDPWAWDNSLVVPTATFTASFAGAGNQESAASVERIFLGAPAGMESRLAAVQRIARSLLLHRRGGAENFRLDAGQERTARLALILDVVSALLIATAAIALVVSSLNVMNATLISAAERSREIGIRRSIGASRVDVFLQFVIEAALLALVGAVIGCLGGLLLVLLTTALMKFAVANWELHLVSWGPLAAVIVPALVSALFAAYPAWRGAGLPPVLALRRV